MIAYLLPLLLAGADLQVNDVAPDFTVNDIDGKEHTLSKMVSAGPVILAFFPKAGTSGCSAEMTSYRARYSEVTKSSAQLLAISTDDVPSLQSWKKELQAPYTFISDHEGKLVTLFGIKTPVVNYAKRTTFVIDSKRHITRIDTGSDAVDPTTALKAAEALLPAPATPAAK